MIFTIVFQNSLSVNFLQLIIIDANCIPLELIKVNNHRLFIYKSN